MPIIYLVLSIANHVKILIFTVLEKNRDPNKHDNIKKLSGQHTLMKKSSKFVRVYNIVREGFIWPVAV